MIIWWQPLALAWNVWDISWPKRDQDEDWMSTVIITVFDSLESATWWEMTFLEIIPGRYNKPMYEIIQNLIPGLWNLEAGRGNKREKPAPPPNSKNKYYLFPCGSFNWCLVFLSSEPHNHKSLGVGHVNLFFFNYQNSNNPCLDYKFHQGPSSHKHFVDLYYPICQDPHNVLFQDEILVRMIFYQILFSFDYYFDG